MPFELKRFGKVWHIYGTEHGVRYRKSTGTVERGQAELILARLRARIFDEVVLGKPAAQRRTFAEAVEIYLDDGKSGRFLKPIVAEIGETPLCDVGGNTINTLAKTLYPGAAPATINRQLIAPVSAVLRRAAREKWCDAPSFEKRDEGAGSITRWLTPDEAEQLLRCAEPDLARRITFYLATGARRAELDNLTWSGVLPGEDRVEWYAGKTGVWRAIDLCPRAQALLGARGAPDEHVVAPMNKRTLHKHLWAAAERAGLGKVHPHMFRHTWATWTYAATGRTLELVGKEGQPWKSMQMVTRYTKRASKALGEQVRALGWCPADRSLTEIREAA